MAEAKVPLTRAQRRVLEDAARRAAAIVEDAAKVVRDDMLETRGLALAAWRGFGGQEDGLASHAILDLPEGGSA